MSPLFDSAISTICCWSSHSTPTKYVPGGTKLGIVSVPLAASISPTSSAGIARCPMRIPGRHHGRVREIDPQAEAPLASRPWLLIWWLTSMVEPAAAAGRSWPRRPGPDGQAERPGSHRSRRGCSSRRSPRSADRRPRRAAGGRRRERPPPGPGSTRSSRRLRPRPARRWTTCRGRGRPRRADHRPRGSRPSGRRGSGRDRGFEPEGRPRATPPPRPPWPSPSGTRPRGPRSPRPHRPRSPRRPRPSCTRPRPAGPGRGATSRPADPSVRSRVRHRQCFRRGLRRGASGVRTFPGRPATGRLRCAGRPPRGPPARYPPARPSPEPA